MTRHLSMKAVPTDTFAPHPQPGDVLGEKYRIERVLGSGGMGVVFEVTHLVMTKNRFAVKWLLPLEDGEAGARRFRREARISGAIRHPHVVQVYDVNFDASGSYMVMELLHGESLAGRIARSGALPPAEACRILLRCLSAVSAAHAAGVIHRDLKPANIFLCGDGEAGAVHPKVLDFGISRVIAGPGGDTTQTREAIVGTPAYMAPEQLRAQPCDARTDVYALGLTLYEALSGQRAYQAEDDVSLMVKIVTGELQPLSEINPDLPPGLSQVVMMALDRAPASRFARVEDFAQALQPFAEDASPPTETRVLLPRLSLYPGDAPQSWAAAAVLTLGIAAALLARHSGDEPEAARDPSRLSDDAAAELSVQPASPTTPSNIASTPEAAGSAAPEPLAAPEPDPASQSDRPPQQRHITPQPAAARVPLRSAERSNAAISVPSTRSSPARSNRQAPSRPRPSPKLDSL